jgi:hypothetical protein
MQGSGISMKMLIEYVEKALHFEQLATSEKDPSSRPALQGKHKLTENWRQNGSCVNHWRPPKIQTETPPKPRPAPAA